MDYIGVPGQPTHCAGHVLGLSFSNIPFAQSAVDASMHSGSDHETMVTSVPISTPGTPHLEQYHYRVPKASLPKFSGLVEIGVQNIPDPLATGRSTARGLCHAAYRNRTARCTDSRQARPQGRPRCTMVDQGVQNCLPSLQTC
ncbi:RNA-directed DNA polymerase from transposon x-element [Paraphaeosphaeria sporulosa]